MIYVVCVCVCVCVCASMCVALSSNRYTTVSLRGSWYGKDGHSEGVGSMPEGEDTGFLPPLCLC